MIDRIKKTFALTENGARGMIRASVGAFLMYVGYMLPITALMIFIQDMLVGAPRPMWFYLLAIGLVAGIMYALINHSYMTTYTETYKEAANLRIEIAEILKKLPLSYFSRHNLADLSQTIMQDVADMEHAMSHAIPELIGFIVYFIVIALMMLAGSWKLALAIIIPVVVSFLLLLLSKRMQVRATTKYYGQLRDNSDAFQEAIELQQEIKSYGQKEAVQRSLKEAIDRTEKMHITTEIAQALPTTLSTSLIRFILGATVITGALLYQRGEISILFLMGYLIAAARVMDGISSVFANMAELMYIDARIQRISELRNTPGQEGAACNLKAYDIVLDGVSFAYNRETPVIRDVSFVARQGQVTALIGPSGCGKTTLLRLMSRLYDYDEGSITIDGMDIKGADTEELFRNISIVFQDVTLFNTSIMENIRLGRKGASDEEVREAARLARCEEFILKSPEGYETLVGENGMKLSGGERQRLSIARAILKNAPIILLDEISASLDVENEMAIQESLNHLIAGKTVVIISHRLKSIEKADQIVVMNQGSIDSIGRHEDLLVSSPLYRSLQEKAGMTEAFEY